MTEKDRDSYYNERIVGHSIEAWRKEEHRDTLVGRLCKKRGVEPLLPEYIIIEESDIGLEKGGGWSRHVRITPQELKEIYEHVFKETGEEE